MELTKVIQEIDFLNAKLEKLKPLKKEVQEKLYKKYRLDWNYNSNNIEGNTLTYGETELLLIFDELPKNIGDKNFREFEEMKAHDVALKMIEDLAKDKERPLTENFIRQLNEVILVRPFWKDAITTSGEPTKKQIKIGEYKSTPNSVQTSTGEIFQYASPEETPALMHDLMHWMDEEINIKKTHPLVVAALLHYKFVRIHPFDDGNGRISRLIMNYVLLKNNFPPAIIQSKDKKGYLTALNRADSGDLEAFIVYVGEQLIRSLEMSIKAARGENIEEADDLDKKIEILKRQLQNDNSEVIKRTTELTIRASEGSVYRLLNEIIDKVTKFNELFAEQRIFVAWANDVTIELEPSMTPSKIRNYFCENVSSRSCQVTFRFHGFKKAGTYTFSCVTDLDIEFDNFYFSIVGNKSSDQEITLKKLYSQEITLEEAKSFATKFAEKIISDISTQYTRATGKQLDI
jgi:Fic family protein